jgi:aerotaxis receptor
MNKIVPLDEESVFNAKVALCQTDLNGNITFANRKFCEISGYTLEELIGSSHKIIRHPDTPENVLQKIHKSLSNAQVFNSTIKNLRKDGRYYWVDIEIIPIYNDNKELMGYISVSKPPSKKNIADAEKTYQLKNSSE